MTVPFGLTMLTPTQDCLALPELSGATLDPSTQLGTLDGVPLHAHPAALVLGSTQTNPDGQDPMPSILNQPTTFSRRRCAGSPLGYWC